MSVTAGLNPRRIVRSLTKVASGVTTSDHLARLLGCTPLDLSEPLAELANDGRVIIWPARQGVLGVMLARTNRPKSKKSGRKANTGIDLDNQPAKRTVSSTLDDRHCYGMPEPGMILLGVWVFWRGPRWESRRPCPVCGGRPLSVDTYCLVCDRCGRDGSSWGRRNPPEPARRRLPAKDGLKGGKS